MLRVLLVIEDLTQMNALKVMLGKLGCVVETQGVELGLKDRIIACWPEVVITSGTGKRVNPLTVTQKVRESSKDIKVLLLMGRGMNLSLNDLAENRYDAFIESPVDPLRLVTVLNQFNKGKHNIDLVEKYQKLMGGPLVGSIDPKSIVRKGQVDEEKSRSVFGNKFLSTKDDENRVKAYESLTLGLTLSPTSTISKAAARVKVAELQKGWDRKRLDEIDQEKRRFVKELFRKK